MIAVTIEKTVYQVPEKWNELTPAQVLFFAENVWAIIPKMFVIEDGKVVDADDYLIRQAQIGILFSHLGMSWKQFERLKAPVLHALLNKHGLAVWMISGRNLLTRNPLPTVGELDGPGDNFSTLRLWEFTFADRAYQGWKSSKSESLLQALCAILYRSRKEQYDPSAPDWDGDLRQPFNNKNVEMRLPLVAEWKNAQRLAVALWYEGCRNQLQQDFPEVFTTGTQETASKEGWETVVHSIAGNKFGPFESTKQTHVRDVMRELQYLIRARKEQERKLKQKS